MKMGVFVIHLRSYIYSTTLLPLMFILKPERGDCQGQKTFVSHLSLKFKTSYMTCHSSACSTAARYPGEITISLTFVCRVPSCIKRQGSSLRFFRLYCTTICMQRKTCHLQLFIQQMKWEILKDFAFWYIIPILSSSSWTEGSAVMSELKE